MTINKTPHKKGWPCTREYFKSSLITELIPVISPDGIRGAPHFDWCKPLDVSVLRATFIPVKSVACLDNNWYKINFESDIEASLVTKRAEKFGEVVQNNNAHQEISIVCRPIAHIFSSDSYSIKHDLVRIHRNKARMSFMRSQKHVAWSVQCPLQKLTSTKMRFETQNNAE